MSRLQGATTMGNMSDPRQSGDRRSKDRGPEQSGAEPRSGTGLDWVLAIFTWLVVFAATTLGLAFLPWTVGQVPVPLSVLLVVAALVWATRTTYRLVGSMWAAAGPVLVWFVLMLYLAFAVYLPSGLVPAFMGYQLIPADWRTTLMLGAGAIAGVGTLGGLWGDHLARRMQSS